MSKVRLYGDTSGFVDLKAPDVAGDVTITLPNSPFDFEVGYRYAGTRYYTSDGTFAKADPLGTGDIGLRAIRVRLVGAGGGGAGCAANPGATSRQVGRSGGGGGYGESFITDIAGLDASVTVTRGAGGTGGAAGANSGSAGGTSSFGALVSASGGGGGVAGGTATDGVSLYLASPAGGGSSITADLAIPGFPAGPDITSSGFGFAQGTPSGGSHLAGGIGGLSTSTFIAGVNGRSNGGGATGAVSRGASATAQAGGDGGNGIVIVDCYV